MLLWGLCLSGRGRAPVPGPMTAAGLPGLLVCGAPTTLGMNGFVAWAMARGDAPELIGATPNDGAVGVAAPLASLVLVLHGTLR